MKMKMLALFILLATVCVQAEQIKVSSLEELRGRLDEACNAYPKFYLENPELKSVGRLFLGRLLEKSGFLTELAGKELDSAYVAKRLRFVGADFAVGETIFLQVLEGLLNSDGRDDESYKAAIIKASTETEQIILGLLLNQESYGGEWGELVVLGSVSRSWGAESLIWYNSLMRLLYTAFLQDYPKALEEECKKLDSKLY